MHSQQGDLPAADREEGRCVPLQHCLFVSGDAAVIDMTVAATHPSVAALGHRVAGIG